MSGLTNKKYLTLFLLFLGVLTYILFGASFSSYFFQDDWFSLQISTVSSILDVFRFFIPRTDVIYYRPLGMQFIFFLFQKLFYFIGIDPLPFRMATFLIHIVNGYLVYRILSFIHKNEKVGMFSAVLYISAAVHFTIFYWAATIAFAMAPFFYFGAFLFFLEKKNKLSLSFFILGLFTNELLITFPAIIFTWSLLQNKKQLKETLWFWVIFACYVGARFILFKPPTTGSYAVEYAPLQILLNFRDYVLWSFNFPEEIHNQFVNWFMLNPVFVKEFFPYIASFGLTLLGFFVLMVVGISHSLYAKDKIMYLKYGVFGVIWFVGTLAPVLFFSNHAFSYYLAIPLLGMFITLFAGLSELMKKNSRLAYGIISVFCLVWIIASYQSIRFNTFIHWAPRRALLSFETLQRLRWEVSQPKRGSALHVPGGDEYIWALSDQHGVQVFFNDPTLKTIYDK